MQNKVQRATITIYYWTCPNDRSGGEGAVLWSAQDQPCSPVTFECHYLTNEKKQTHLASIECVFLTDGDPVPPTSREWPYLKAALREAFRRKTGFQAKDFSDSIVDFNKL